MQCLIKGMMGPKRALLRTMLIFLIAFSTLSAAGTSPSHAQTYSFSRVEVIGNLRVDSSTILTYAGISRGEQVDAARLNDAYQSIINSGLFETVELEPRGNTLTVRVQEFPTINQIAFEGNDRLKDDVLETIIGSKPAASTAPVRPKPMPPASRMLTNKVADLLRRSIRK